MQNVESVKVRDVVTVHCSERDNAALAESGQIYLPAISIFYQTASEKLCNSALV
jgi:hypothetical protein